MKKSNYWRLRGLESKNDESMDGFGEMMRWAIEFNGIYAGTANREDWIRMRNWGIDDAGTTNTRIARTGFEE